MTIHDQTKQTTAPMAPLVRTLDLEPFAKYLNDAVSDGASAQGVADVVARTFEGIGQVLAPIIGQQGMEALYRRSLHLAGSICAQIASTSKSVSMAMNLELLKAELGKQTASVAVYAGTNLIHVFHVLLTSLIGPSLTEQLLRSIWVKFHCGLPARDIKA